MAWYDLTFVECSILTAEKMTRLQGNFSALAAGESGSPSITKVGSFVAEAGSMNALQVSSLTVLQDLRASGVASLENLNVAGTSSLNQLSVASGAALTALQVGDVASLATLHVASDWSFPGSGSFGHFSADSGGYFSDLTSGATPAARTVYGTPHRLEGQVPVRQDLDLVAL